MKTKIFKVIYESKEMPLMATKFSDNTEEEKKLLNECQVKDGMVLFNFIDQTPGFNDGKITESQKNVRGGKCKCTKK